MFRNVLRAAIFAIAGIVTAAPASATGKVEVAWQLWNGDLKSAYDATVKSLEGGNIDQGKSDVANLVDKLSRMNDAVSAVISAGNGVAPELGALWTDSQSAVAKFQDAAKALQSTLGSSTPDLGNLKSAQSGADSAVLKSRDGTNKFAQYYVELVLESNGYIPSANQLFRNAVTEAYTDTYDDLKDGKIDTGRGFLKTLRAQCIQLEVLISKGRDGAKGISPKLAALWEPVYQTFPTFMVNVGGLEATVGKVDYKSGLNDIQKAYSDLNDTMKSSIAAIQDFGNKLKEVTDDVF